MKSAVSSLIRLNASCCNSGDGTEMNASIRLAGLEDAAAIRAIYGPAVATPISFELAVPTEQEMRRRIAKTLTTYPWLVCEQGGRVVGYAYGSRHRQRAAYDWSVEVSAYVDQSCRRKGVGRALYLALFKALSCQGYYSAFAGITVPNPESVGFHESVGFRPIGVFHRIGFKNGAWHDVGWWELFLATQPEIPPPLLSLEELLDSPGWQAALRLGEEGLR
jgi:L-amino acid N-acyltransferase YncA